MPATHTARLSPLQAPTVWRIEDGVLIQTRGRRERRLPLNTLRRLHVAPGGAVLGFRGTRITIPARGYDGWRLVSASDSFAAFARDLAAVAPDVRVEPEAPPLAEAVLWAVILLACGAVTLVVFAGLSGAWRLGLTLAAPLAAIALLTSAVLVWLRRRRKMDTN